MKLKLLSIFLLSITAFLNAQEKEATIIFNDSTTVQGFAEIKREKIFFRVDNNSEVSKWEYDMAKGVIFTGYGYYEKYEYVKLSPYTNPKIMQVIEEGAVNLYKKSYIDKKFYSYPSPSINGSGGSYSQTFETDYYVKRNSEEYATDLSTSFKYVASSYFSDCPIIIKKINSRVFNSHTILELVYYYNDYCGDEDEG